jgi:hypothetical protein
VCVLILYVVETLLDISVAVYIKTVFGMNFETFFGSNETIVFILLCILT